MPEERPSKVKDITILLCPEGHGVPVEPWNYAREFVEGGRDAMTLQPVFESGAYCHGCDQAYGLSKLTEPSPNKP